MQKTLIIMLFLTISCIKKHHLEPGIYHYYDEKESNGIVSKTIRIKPDSTFYLFGIRLNHTKIDPKNIDTEKYITYITYGDWHVSNKYLILNANNEYLARALDFYQLEDSVFTLMRNANSMTVVPAINNDSFLIRENSKVLEELSTKFRMVFTKK